MKAKRLKRFFASAAFVLCSITSFCCAPYEIMVEEYYMYRVYDKSMDKEPLPQSKQNCDSWKRITSTSIDSKDVWEVVYKYSKDKTSGILSGKKTGNSFADWLRAKKDSETVDFLVLAKTCEEARFEMNDPWYYPTKNDPTMATLNAVITNAVSYNGSRLEDRYVLQAVRAMFSLKKFSSIDSLWQSRKDNLKDGVIKDMIVGYVAGAAYNAGEVQKAFDYFVEYNDLESLSLYLGKAGKGSDKMGLLSYASEHCPDNPQIPKILQGLFYGSEPSEYFYYHNPETGGDIPDYKTRAHLCRAYNKSETEKYVSICLKAAGNAKEPGIWYYTAAYLTDLLGNPEKAQELVEKALLAKKSPFIEESVKVLQIYLDAKTSKYDSAYESRLLSQLEWLDDKIKMNITDEVRRITEKWYDIHIGISCMYWNDMMCRILISEVCPRMKDAGKTVTAIALHNMADNRLLSLVNSYSSTFYDEETDEYFDKKMTLDEFRHSKYHNYLDFCNDYFHDLNRVDLKYVEQYAKILESGDGSALEKFAIARGYKDVEYVYDIIGTRYLRKRKYAKAVVALLKVSSGYQNRLNVRPYCNRDPFQYGFIKKRKKYKNYKINFAREMLALEKKMTSSNPDVKGTAMVKYGIGLRASFDFCWALTDYLPHSYKDECMVQALEDAENYINEGLATIKDKEIAAKAHLSVCKWKTVAEKYPDTEAGRKVISCCDKLYDHQGYRYWTESSIPEFE